MVKIEVIKSNNNPSIKQANLLKQKKYRIEENKCLLEGLKILEEAVKTCQKVEVVFTLSEYFEEVKKIDSSLNIKVVSYEVLKHLSSVINPKDCVSVIKVKQNTFNLPTKNYLVLDSIQDPSNLGAIIRTAVATDFTQIYLIDCCDEFNEKVIRSSMGNLFKCKFYHINYNDVSLLNNNLYIADMKGQNIFTVKEFKNIVGLCIGNEGHGVSNEIREKITNYFSIPMSNDVESLNAAVSASILMYSIKSNQKEM